MENYKIPDDFERLYAENSMLRAELAAMLEEYEYCRRWHIPITKMSYLIQIGALSAELLQLQIEVRKIRRRIALMRENIYGESSRSVAEIEAVIADEFVHWDERLAYEQREVDNAKASFSSMTLSEDMPEIRAICRALSRKMNPDVNDEQSDEAKAFWPSIHTAYAMTDLFQLKALAMMAEDYPESYDMPNDVGAMRRANERLKERKARAEERLRQQRGQQVFEWRALLDSPQQLDAEQRRLRGDIASAKVQRTALSDMLRSLERKAGVRSEPVLDGRVEADI